MRSWLCWCRYMCSSVPRYSFGRRPRRLSFRGVDSADLGRASGWIWYKCCTKGQVRNQENTQKLNTTVSLLFLSLCNTQGLLVTDDDSVQRGRGVQAHDARLLFTGHLGQRRAWPSSHTCTSVVVVVVVVVVVLSEGPAFPASAASACACSWPAFLRLKNPMAFGCASHGFRREAAQHR